MGPAGVSVRCAALCAQRSGRVCLTLSPRACSLYLVSFLFDAVGSVNDRSGPATKKKGQEEEQTDSKSNHVTRKLKLRSKDHKVDNNLADQFTTGYVWPRNESCGDATGMFSKGATPGERERELPLPLFY